MKHTTLKNTVKLLALSVCSAFVAIFIFSKLNTSKPDIIVQQTTPIKQYASLPMAPAVNTDFTVAAEKAVDAVVHVTVVIEKQAYANYSNPFLDFFFGDGNGSYSQPRTYKSMGSGSGVIISKEGYIVTNNHVIEDSKNIKVVLNDKRSYSATLVGTDPITDIALIKLEDTNGEEFPTLNFGNSEDIKIGEWVLAVGNPFSLSTTVTAGIVSAKGRNMYNMQSQSPYNGQNDPDKMNIESFIQTDAAVNPGNSGGALVNTNGELIGINTAIASPTGTYAGYSFAVPSTIVKKVVADLMEYGEIKRAFLGVTISDINKQLAEEKNLKTLKGAYISALSDDGAAKEAGIKTDDVVIAINNSPVNSVSELQEQITRYRPGDQITAKVLRGKEEKSFTLTLKDEYGNKEVISNTALASLGIELSPIDNDLKQSLNINSGVQISKINNGKLKSKGVQKGYIITKINNHSVNDVESATKIINSISDGLFLTGVYPNGIVAYYAINMEK